MPVKPAATSTTEGRDTRARLVETAAELLWTRSFYSTGVDEICQRAEVRRGSLYHFFPSKADLAIAAIEEGWARVRDEVFEPEFDVDRTGLARLRKLAEAIDRFQRDARDRLGAVLGCPFGSLGQEMAHQDERVQHAVDEVFERHVDYFERALEQAVAEEEAEPGDLRRRARRILAYLEGALLLAKVADRPDRFTDCIDGVILLATRDAG